MRIASVAPARLASIGIPAAGVPIEAKRAGATVAIVNAEETDLDDLADVVVRGQAGAVLRQAVQKVRAIQAL